MDSLKAGHSFDSANHQDDSKIWADVQEGDHTSFRVLYMTYTDILYNYGMKICHNDDLVLDCIQDLFEYLWHKKKTIEIKSSIKFYLLTSLKRAIFKKYKGDQKLRSLVLEDRFELSIESKVISEEVDVRRKEMLTRAINNLTKRQREIIFLRFHENLSYEEISSIMSLNYNSAYKLLHGAIKRIRDAMMLILVFFNPF